MKAIKYLHKKYLWFYMPGLILLFLLCRPGAATEGARNGLLLWWNLIPSLLPFLILTQFFIRSNILDHILEKLHLSHYLFVLSAGLLFGFPMGAKLSSELYRKRQLSRREASLLVVCANQMSPAFVGGYVLSDTLGRPELTGLTYLILYGLPGMIALLAHMLWPDTAEPTAQKKTPGLQLSFAILDASIMNSFETMLRLGGYIMLFSILQALVRVFVSCPVLVTGLSSLLEVTGAIQVIHASFNQRMEYVFRYRPDSLSPAGQ
jgi:hypothetical protein